MGEDRVAELVARCLERHTVECLVDAFEPRGHERTRRREFREFFGGDFEARKVTAIMIHDLEQLATCLCVCKMLPERPRTHVGGKRQSAEVAEYLGEYDGWGVQGVRR